MSGNTYTDYCVPGDTYPARFEAAHVTDACSTVKEKAARQRLVDAQGITRQATLFPLGYAGSSSGYYTHFAMFCPLFGTFHGFGPNASRKAYEHEMQWVSQTMPGDYSATSTYVTGSAGPGAACIAYGNGSVAAHVLWTDDTSAAGSWITTAYSAAVNSPSASIYIPSGGGRYLISGTTGANAVISSCSVPGSSFIVSYIDSTTTIPYESFAHDATGDYVIAARGVTVETTDIISTNGGYTWNQQAHGRGVNNGLYQVAYDHVTNSWIGITDNLQVWKGTVTAVPVWTSVNYVSVGARLASSVIDMVGIPGMLIALVTQNSVNYVWTSIDGGYTWSNRGATAATKMYASNGYVILTGPNGIWTSRRVY